MSKLIQLTYDRPYKKGRGGGGGGRKGEQQHARPLLRPIICICNDLYASSLTKLRQHARIVRFARPHDTHVVRRLREICEREVPLTYHHLIPREVHDKVLKKKWHPEAMLNSVAWLCRYAQSS